jgi:hypothetical protein
VSDTLMQGCRAIVVESISDQLYLSAMKVVLIAGGRIKPSRELVFVPTSGAKAIKTVAAILGGRDNDLPVVLCDGDHAAGVLAKSLRDEMYSGCQDRVVLVTDVLPSVPLAEIEDLFPTSFLAPIIDRYLRGPDDQPFSPSEKAGAILPQVEAYAKKHKIELAKGWKVEVARLAKPRVQANVLPDAVWLPVLTIWQQLFKRLMGEATRSAS